MRHLAPDASLAAIKADGHRFFLKFAIAAAGFACPDVPGDKDGRPPTTTTTRGE
jgi:hypothetical protein